jgi:RND family efflux transporter MFP subunit
MKQTSLILIPFLALPLVAQTVKLPGELKPWQRVSLTSRVTGIVDSVEVDRGSVVKQGQLLVRLSAPEMKARIAEAESRGLAVGAQKAEADARLSAAESTLERLKTAAKTAGAVAENDIVQAEKTVQAARAAGVALEKSAAAAGSYAQSLKELEEYLRITAPLSGVVTVRRVHPGALASPQSGALLEIEQVSKLRLEVALPEAEVARIPIGARVQFSVPAHPGRVFTGIVARQARSLDASTRTLPVELDVENGHGTLAPGMYAEVAWPRAAKPEAAKK